MRTGTTLLAMFNPNSNTRRVLHSEFPRFLEVYVLCKWTNKIRGLCKESEVSWDFPLWALYFIDTDKTLHISCKKSEWLVKVISHFAILPLVSSFTVQFLLEQLLGISKSTMNLKLKNNLPDKGNGRGIKWRMLASLVNFVDARPNA